MFINKETLFKLIVQYFFFYFQTMFPPVLQEYVVSKVMSVYVYIVVKQFNSN
jgi:hypothetical protein